MIECVGSPQIHKIAVGLAAVSLATVSGSRDEADFEGTNFGGTFFWRKQMLVSRKDTTENQSVFVK